MRAAAQIRQSTASGQLANAEAREALNLAEEHIWSTGNRLKLRRGPNAEVARTLDSAQLAVTKLGAVARLFQANDARSDDRYASAWRAARETEGDLIARRLVDQVEWLRDCTRWLAQLELGKYPLAFPAHGRSLRQYRQALYDFEKERWRRCEGNPHSVRPRHLPAGQRQVLTGA